MIDCVMETVAWRVSIISKSVFLSGFGWLVVGWLVGWLDYYI